MSVLSTILRPSLRKKLLFFSVLLAIIPLGIAGDRMITITQDELKSAANDELRVTAEQISSEIDDFYRDTWLAPLLLVKNVIENEKLGVVEKYSLMQSATRQVEDIIWLQVNADADIQPFSVYRAAFDEKLTENGLDKNQVLKISRTAIADFFGEEGIITGELEYIEKIDTWLTTIYIPLELEINSAKTLLSARINLNRLINEIKEHPFNNTGKIFVTDKNGFQLFTKDKTDLSGLDLVKNATDMLRSGTRLINIQPYTKPDGQKMLGAYSMPGSFDWAVISERSEENAYLAVFEMFKSLMIWVTIGLIIAVVGAIWFSRKISKPILQISDVAVKVGHGDFQVRVDELKSKDEISHLGRRMNTMIEELRERFELTKFVSGHTIDAIKKSDVDGIKLGGARDNATVFFSDIRGFTAFSEKVEPEIVIEMLNLYLRHQAHIVKKYHGDIDKYVGDELVAVFRGEQMVENAARSAIEIHQKMKELNDEHPDWDIGIGIGINTGDMIFGAMGSEERMDYTILGDNVNLGARLCSAAKGNQTIISESSYNQIKDSDIFVIEQLEKLRVKGKSQPIQIYQVNSLK